MSTRTFEDRLRAEYFELLPHIRRAADEVEAEIRHFLVPFARQLESHERIVIKTRIKDWTAPSLRKVDFGSSSALARNSELTRVQISRLLQRFLSRANGDPTHVDACWNVLGG